MKTHRPLGTPVVLAVLVGIVGGVGWGSPPALANSVTIPISGTAAVGNSQVSLSGQAQVTSTLVTDPDFNTPPGVVLRIQLSVTGTSGSGKQQVTYVAPGEDFETRLLAVSDLLEIPFPVFPASPGGELLARSMLVSLTLSFDTTTGDITAGTGTITTSSF